MSTDLAGIGGNISHGRCSHAAIVDHTTVAVVAQDVLRDGRGAPALNLMLVPEHRHSGSPSPVVQERAAIDAMRQHCHQRGLATIHASSHCKGSHTQLLERLLLLPLACGRCVLPMLVSPYCDLVHTA